MALNFTTVQKELKDKGWKLISEEYKNRLELLIMECPYGHKIKDTYEHWRKTSVCETCDTGDTSLIKRNEIPLSNSSDYRILALDAATTTSGYAFYDNRQLINYGTFITNKEDITARINEVKYWVKEICNCSKPNMVVIEHIQLQKFGNGNNDFQVELYRKLANLQGVIADLLYEMKISFDFIYPSTWREYCDIAGKSRSEKKKAAQSKVDNWFNITATQDEADAICLGRYYSNKENNKKISWGENVPL